MTNKDWKSIKNEFPRMGDPVLLCNSLGEVNNRIFYRDHDDVCDFWQDFGDNEDGIAFSAGDHWMPLPDASSPDWLCVNNCPPEDGLPVLLLSSSGVVQHHTFYLDSDDNGQFWQDVGDNCDPVPFSSCTKWMPLPEPVKAVC